MKRRPRKTPRALARRPVPFAQFLARLPPALRPLARRALAAPAPCLLCQAPGQTLGTFIPLDPPQWGVPPGWRAGRVYTLCGGCGALPDVRHRVEQVLWQERAVLAAPWN
jgi:hypothetical protein